MNKTKFFSVVVCVCMLSVASAFSQGLIINHTCTDISMVPRAVIDSAKAHFRMSYGHTSHGSQVISGMEIMAGHDTLFHFFNDNYHYRYGGSNPLAPVGDLSVWDYTPDGDLGAPDRVTWAHLTNSMLNSVGYALPVNRNLVMWSWCGQAGWATTAEIDTYLFHMEELQTNFPNVTFVYMTGHLDGSGESGTLNQNNNRIRQHCIDHNRVLFDFADIESYDPDGDYFLDLYANDNCDYNGGNWAQEWCAEHPGDPLCESCSCAHSQSINCNRKARAFWYMLARLEGWSETSLPTPQNVTSQIDATTIILRWSAVTGATSYKIYSSTISESGYTEDLTGTFAGLSWTAPITGDKKFYYVQAVERIKRISLIVSKWWSYGRHFLCQSKIQTRTYQETRCIMIKYVSIFSSATFPLSVARILYKVFPLGLASPDNDLYSITNNRQKG